MRAVPFFLQELKVKRLSLQHNSCQPYSQVLILGTLKWIKVFFLSISASALSDPLL